MDENSNTNAQEQPAEDLPDRDATAEVEETDAAGLVDELQGQLTELNDRYLRVHAEMDNMKKRQERDRKEVVKFGKESLLREFLPVFDAIEKSILSAREHHPDDEAFIEGLRMTEKMLIETLKRHYVEPIETQDKPFDPNYHEALMQVKRDDLASGMVVDEIEKGFMLHERVLRPAKVTVSA